MVNSLGIFFYGARPINVPLVCGFSPSLRMINLKNLYLFAPPYPTNYYKATYIVSSNLCLFTCPQATGFPWLSLPTDTEAFSAKRCFSNSSPCLMLGNFSNNLPIPQVWVNMKKIEHDTTFEIS